MTVRSGVRRGISRSTRRLREHRARPRRFASGATIRASSSGAQLAGAEVAREVEAAPGGVNGTLAPRVLVVLGLTFDHGVLDDSLAAAFLDDVVARLEEPALLRATAAPDLAPVS